ncbi:MAG: efflux RND transporter periplasmic adaptor subunit [Candidatus Paceibacterota bacterium]|jgi:RND family efflux transporter MFP subunit
MAFKLNFGFLKSKKFIIFSVIALIIVISIVFLSGQGKIEKYDTVKVLRGDLVQTVDVTGNLQSSDNLELHFQVPGVVSSVRVSEGSQVKKGQLLANLSLAELDAAVAAAQASLDQKLAGATLEQINASQKQIDSAQTALINAQALATISLNSKYDAALTSLSGTSVKMANAFKVMREIQLRYFTDSSQESFSFRNNLDLINNAQFKFKQSLLIAEISKSRNDIDATITQAAEGLDVILTALTANRDIIDKDLYKTVVTTIDKTSIEEQKSIISAEKINISGIKNDIIVSKSQNENNISSAEAALNLQKANYESLIAKPRDVDVAYYEAALDQAKANRNKAILIAPISGEISKVYKKVGELVSSIDPMIELISPHFEIDVDVPETDVVKLKVDDKATITFDALGTDIKFDGIVMSIEPSSTNIQDVVYYKVKVGISETEDDVLKSGMTTNITVNTADREGVLYVPLRSVLTRNDTGQKYVRTLVNNEIVEKDVITGLKADGGLVEIISGLLEGEVIVLKIL